MRLLTPEEKTVRFIRKVMGDHLNSAGPTRNHVVDYWVTLNGTLHFYCSGCDWTEDTDFVEVSRWEYPG